MGIDVCSLEEVAMEAKLEGMLVGGWVQVDRENLMLKVEALEGEISHMAAEGEAERKAFKNEMENLNRRIVESEDEFRGVVKELSFKTQREKKLRRICQRRVQELQAEATLLGEQLRTAEAKFKETEKALWREKSNNFPSRHSIVPSMSSSVSRSKGRDNPEPTDKTQRRSRDQRMHGDGLPSFCLSLGRGDNDFRNQPGCEIYRGVSEVQAETSGKTGELKVMKSLVAGLLEENLLLRSTVKQLKGTSGRASPSRASAASVHASDAMGGAPIKREESSQRNEEDPTEQPTAGFDPTAGPDPKEKQEKNVLACTQVALALPNNTSSPAEATQVPNAVRSEGGQERHLHKRDGICRDKKSSESGVVDGAMVTGSDVGVSSALSKIKALAGMVRAQEEIETLLSQELGQLEKEAKRLWRLLIRWKEILESRGHATENDIRSVGLLEQWQKRLETKTRVVDDRDR